MPDIDKELMAATGLADVGDVVGGLFIVAPPVAPDTGVGVGVRAPLEPAGTVVAAVEPLDAVVVAEALT